MNALTRGERVPCVSIGLPVYNGEAYLDATFASILAQDFGDFEVIVCDNASTDATPAIAAAWAARDRRVRVYRNETNIGLEGNFDRSLELARGRYFRWAASDDLIATDYLSSCLARLEAAPDAVLCQSWLHVIDGSDRVIGAYDGGLTGAESSDPARRFAAVLSRHLCTHIFGLMRTAALRATRPFAPYYGSDRARLAELVLLGHFVHVPKPLFMSREHPARGSRVLHRQAAARRGSLTLLLYGDYWRAVTTHVQDHGTRARCRLHLLRWWMRDWNLARVAAEITAGVYPPVGEVVHSLKLRFYGPLPQVLPVTPSQELPSAVGRTGPTSGIVQPARPASRIAVVIPVYNQPDDLARTLASVDRQNASFEFFIVDDGSKPPLSLDPAAYRHPLHVITLPVNRGCTVARNVALTRVFDERFDYVALQDAGDVDIGERMARQAQFLDTHRDIAAVGAWAEYVDRAGRHLFVHRAPATAAEIHTRMSYVSAFTHPATMIRVSALVAVGLYDEAFPIAGDYEMFFRLTRAFSTANLPEVLIKKENHPKSLSLGKRRLSLLYRLRAQGRHFCFGSVHAYLGVAKTCVLLLLPYGLVEAVKRRRGFAT